jgi:hypothetical protein
LLELQRTSAWSRSPEREGAGPVAIPLVKDLPRLVSTETQRWVMENQCSAIGPGSSDGAREFT